MISIFKDKELENKLLNPIKEYKIAKNSSYIVDNNLNYYLKLLCSDLTNDKGREKSYSLIPISQDELNSIIEGITSLDGILNTLFEGLFLSFKMTEFHDFTTFSSQRSIELYRHT